MEEKEDSEWWKMANGAAFAGESEEVRKELCSRLAWWRDLWATFGWPKGTTDGNWKRFSWGAFLYEGRARISAAQSGEYRWELGRPFNELRGYERAEFGKQGPLNPISSTIYSMHLEGKLEERGWGWTPPMQINLQLPDKIILGAIQNAIHTERAKQGIEKKRRMNLKGGRFEEATGIPWSGLEAWDKEIILGKFSTLSEAEKGRKRTAKATLEKLEIASKKLQEIEDEKEAREAEKRRWKALSKEEQEKELRDAFSRQLEALEKYERERPEDDFLF